MAFQTIPINIVGGTYQNRSKALSSQLTVNMYQQLNSKAKDQASLQSFPGQKAFGGVTGILDRGMHNMNEILYRVVDDRLCSVNDKGVGYSLGSILIEGEGRCIFADDGDHLVIIADSVYVYTKSLNTLEISTNVNLVNVLSVTFLKSQFIYTTADLSYVSQPNDPLNVSGLNAIGAESNPDKLVRDYAFNQTLYRFGVRTTEPWYVSGVGSPPIDVIEGQQFSVGLGAIHSLTNTDRALYWLGDDKAIYRVAGGINERISDDGISNSIENMTTISDAIGYSFTLQGQDFYLITFPSENQTFVVNESLGKDGWFNLRSYQDQMYTGTSLVQIYDKLIIADSGSLFTLELDEYTQDSNVMIRERIALEVNSDSLGVKGQRIKMSRLEFIVEAGIGLISGQGENPRIRVETSIDGGQTFDTSAWVELGRLGSHTQRVELFQMLSGQGFVFKITMSDPVPLTISAAAIDVKVVGR